jgi:hypothetical protein
MKKALISIAALAFVALMITSVYAQSLPPAIPAPEFCVCIPGFTPGFWKHDIAVYLELDKGGKGSYNAFEYDNAWGSILAGTKVTASMLDDWLSDINYWTGLSLTFAEAYAILQLPGWDARRTNLANWFNWEAGYGPF